jgi:dienelactone hydrolase
MEDLMMNSITQVFFSLAISVGVLTSTATTARAALIKKDVEYSLAGIAYTGYVVYDDAQKGLRPGLLIAHNWMGITDETKSKAEQMAALGYVAFAVDVYGKNRRPKSIEEAGQFAGDYKKDRVKLRARMQQGLSTLLKQPFVDKNKIAVLGYCFGGTAAIELARAGADVKGVVSFHGGLDDPKPEDNQHIKAKVLALHGADDPYVSADDIKAFETGLRNAKVDWQLVRYGNTVHSFTEKAAGSDNSKGAAYNADSDRRSWQAMKEFLSEIFK